MHHFGFFSSLFAAVIHYLVAFVVIYVMAVIIDGLAPTFSGQKNQQNAMKLAVYSMTPAWLAGVFALIPGLGFLRFLALLYGIYVFWLGLPILMKPPRTASGHTHSRSLFAGSCCRLSCRRSSGRPSQSG